MIHGRASTYVNYGCRCTRCTMANTEKCRREKAARVAAGRINHGTLSGYINHGCRCDPCRASKAAYVAVRAAKTREVATS